MDPAAQVIKVSTRPATPQARIIVLNRRDSRSARELLTRPIKSALEILLADGSLIRKGHFWYGSSGGRVAYQTIEAMYSRALCKIVTESRHRRKQMAELTEIGLRVARDLKRERDSIVDAGDHFEDATEVYGDRDET
jgi:hypothetical protein